MAASGANVSRLLVLGADASDARAVLSKLRELCGDCSSSVVAPADEAFAQTLTLRTKYYSAEVEAHAHTILENNPPAVLAHDLHEYEAVLCVVNPGDRESFVHVRGFLERLAETEHFDVCLLVGSTRPDGASVSTKLQPIDRAHLDTWCQDYAFEFISLDEDGNQDGGEGTQGISRVLEALQCNMWKSMVRGPPPTARTVLPSAGKSESDSDIKEITAASGNQAVDDGDGDDDGSDARLQTLLRALEITEKSDEALGSTPSGNQRVAGRSAPREDEDDVDMAQFSSLIDQVRRVREQGQALTDEQRRQQAAEVAMRLWNFLEVDDDDDSSSE